MTTIYIYLMNEGTESWRPVNATQVGKNEFRVEGPVPEDEEWEFAPGSIVRCKQRKFESGIEALVAVELSSQ